MAVIIKEIIIKAPLEKIFNFVMNKDNRLKIWPSLMEINFPRPYEPVSKRNLTNRL